MHLKALAAGSIAALTITGSALAGTNRAPSGIHVTAKQHVSVAIQKATSSNGVVAGGFLAAAVAYLGIDKATVVADLKAGQSLAQIATAHGKTADGLVAALLAPAKLKLDAAVAAGKLTSAREATVVARLTALLTTLVNKTPPPAHPARPSSPRAHVNPMAILQSATSYLGLSLRDVVAQLRTGKTLADVAVAQGKTSAGLVAAVVASLKTTLDAQVAAGRITQQQETDFLARLQTSVTALVTGSLGSHG